MPDTHNADAKRYDVRKLESTDGESWASLRREALENHPLAFGATVPENPDELVQIFTQRLAETEAALFGAFSGKLLVGAVGIRRNPGLKERHKALIWGMYVSSANRRGGAGRMLLQAAMDQARAWPGVKQIHLTVSDVALDAKRLYEKTGFRAWGCEPRALCWRGEYVSETHMVRSL